MIGKRVSLFLMSFLFVSLVWAQNLSIDAFVNKNKVPLGQTVRLTIKVNGTTEVQPIDLPSIEGFDIRYVGPSTQVSIINGQSTSSISFVYTMFPLKTGTFQFPPLSFNFQGQDFKTNPINIEVLDKAAVANNASSSTGGVSLEDKMFLEVSVSDKEVFIGQKVPITFRFLVARDINMREVSLPDFEAIGFSFNEFDENRRSVQVIDGIQYNVLEFFGFIYPTRTGEIKIGPATVQGSIVVDSPRRSRGSLFESFFGGFAQAHPVTVSADPVTLNVKALPEQNRPDHFSGGVGHFAFGVEVSPKDVYVGDPITVRMQLRGDGNLQSVKLPEITGPNFKTYDPQIKQENDSKFLEQVIIPLNENIKQLDPIVFAYFDPEKNSYNEIVQGPFVLNVKPAQKSSASTNSAINVPAAALQEVSQNIGRDILYLKDHLGVLKKNQNFVGSAVFWIWLFVYFVLLVGFLFYELFLSKWLANEQLMRRVKAFKQFEKDINLLRTQNYNLQLWDVLADIVRQYFVDKCDFVQSESLVDFLKQTFSKKDEQGVNQLVSILNEMDAVQFGGVDINQAQLHKCIDELKTIIKRIDRLC